MGILIDKNTRLVVQGITGRDGSFHTKEMIEYGTKVVAGVTPGKGGSTVFGVPVFNTVVTAVRETGANTSVIYVPPRFAVDALYEAADAGVKLVVCITEGLPATDMLKVSRYYDVAGVKLVGPNCPGVITPGVCKVGIMPGGIHRRGPVGLVSRSGTLTYEVVQHLTDARIGQSTCIGIGGDPIIGTRFLDALELFERDRQTEAVVLIGEIGGTDEEIAAEYIKTQMTKPVVSFIAGRTAPPGKRMGHAGAIIAGGAGTAAEKIAAFRAAGVEVADTPAEVAVLIDAELKRRKQRKRARVVVGVRGTTSMAARKGKAATSKTAKKRITTKSKTAKSVSKAKTRATKAKSKAKPKVKAKAKLKTTARPKTKSKAKAKTAPRTRSKAKPKGKVKAKATPKARAKTKVKARPKTKPKAATTKARKTTTKKRTTVRSKAKSSSKPPKARRPGPAGTKSKRKPARPASKTRTRTKKPARKRR